MFHKGRKNISFYKFKNIRNFADVIKKRKIAKDIAINEHNQ